MQDVRDSSSACVRATAPTGKRFGKKDKSEKREGSELGFSRGLSFPHGRWWSGAGQASIQEEAIEAIDYVPSYPACDDTSTVGAGYNSVISALRSSLTGELRPASPHG